MEDATERPPEAYLPDDLIVEILSRLPAKSLCRFKCVSKSWHALVDPARRACFFFLRRRDGIRSQGFVTAKGDDGLPLVDSALSFLPSSTCSKISLLDSCNGLLLLRCKPPAIAAGATVPPRPRPGFYVVCNPATGDWVALPQPSLAPGFDDFYTKTRTAALGFDPSVSSHFHVFQIEEEERMYNYFVDAVEIYSSETGTWARKFTIWTEHPRGARSPNNTPPTHPWLYMTGHKTYFNGFLHLTMCDPDVIAMVDTEGQAWRTIAVPSNGFDRSGFVGHSQGHLVYVDVRMKRVPALAIYVLEDHSRDRWTLRHKVIKRADLFGLEKFPDCFDGNPVVAFHPTCDVFFFYDQKGKRLMSYDMKAKRVHVIRALEDVAVVYVDEFYPFFYLYVPLYSGKLDHRMSTSQAEIGL
ncbi:unnamed protein product [Urochloa decumbens]|uniref:F-box domain-containing protein n=1 Tax=Urochloa decumbens TaxID=240449 RepID=A0ABC9FWX9_9POAL